MRKLLVIFVALLVIANNVAFAARCTGEQIQKMISSGFSKDNIKSLCSESETSQEKSPASTQGNPFSGQWTVQLTQEAAYDKETGQRMDTKSEPITREPLKPIVTGFNIHLHDGQLEIEENGKKLQTSDVHYNDHELSFIIETQTNTPANPRALMLPTYSPPTHSEKTDKFGLRLVDRNQIQGHMKSDLTSVYSEGPLRGTHSVIRDYSITMIRIRSETPSTGPSTSPEIEKESPMPMAPRPPKIP